MAIYSLNINIVSRGKGKSAVAAAAYRAGENITNEYDGRVNDYTHKKGIVYSAILLPENAPAEYASRSVLWNAVEKAEKNKNAQLAREVVLVLPVELDLAQNMNLVHEYVNKNFASKGMCADICIHDKNDGNPHAHVMLTMRPFEKDGSWGTKSKMEYILDDNGERIKLASGRPKTTKISATGWDDQNNADIWRESWANIMNKHLKNAGHEIRVDHRSYAKQGVEQLPTIHLGAVANGLEKRGIRTERGNINRAIKMANAEIENINATLRELETELQQLKTEQHQQEAQPTAPAPFEGYTKAFTEQWEKKLENPKVDAPNPATPKPTQKTSTTPKPASPAKPKPTPKTLQQVEIEIDMVERKLSRLDHVATVVMGYNHKIEDEQRNLNSVGWWERRKMLKEIANQEQKRDDYQANAEKQYGTKSQLNKQLSKLLTEKKQIEDATGVTAAREREQQRKRDEVTQNQQARDRYNAEQKAKRLTNPTKNKSTPER